MSFRISRPFRRKTSSICSKLSDAELAGQGRGAQHRRTRAIPAIRAESASTDSKPGDELILTNYEHHEVDSPYRMRFAIYVRKGEETYDDGRPGCRSNSGCARLAVRALRCGRQ